MPAPSPRVGLRSRRRVAGLTAVAVVSLAGVTAGLLTASGMPAPEL